MLINYEIFSISLIVITSISSAFGNSFFSNRIVNGYYSENDFLAKFIVSLRYQKEDFHFCGGCILTDRVVITAAHCFDKLRGPYYVAAGRIFRLGKEKNEQRREVQYQLIHPDYARKSRWFADIALLFLDASLVEDETTVLRIPFNMYKPPRANWRCVTFGWGQLYKNGPLPNKIMYANITLWPRGSCHAYSYGEMDVDHICSISQSNFCFGDSGGPLVCESVALAGIVSYMYEPCGVDGYFTDVFYHRRWIETHMMTIHRNSQSKSRETLFVISVLFFEIIFFNFLSF